MRTPVVLVVAVLLSAQACSAGHEVAAPQQRAAHAVVAHDAPRPALTPSERRRATSIARHWQRQNSPAFFVGATAFVTQGRPYLSATKVDRHHRFLNVRVVWKAGAFAHGVMAPHLCGVLSRAVFEGRLVMPQPGTAAKPRACRTATRVAVRPDGPRSAMFITVDETTHRSWVVGTEYRDVGAHPGETLLYGEWPDPAQS